MMNHYSFRYSLAYDDYIGRLGIGRVYKGKVQAGQNVCVCGKLKNQEKGRIGKLTVYEGLTG